MKLVHYAASPCGDLEKVWQRTYPYFKPQGFWVSDDDCKDNWQTWCISEGFHLDRLTHVYDVELASDANVLLLSSAEGIAAFNAAWVTDPQSYWARLMLDWERVSEKYAGLIITPYIWERRLNLSGGGLDWYYTWDCASGCIWDPAAIRSVTLREVAPAPEEGRASDA